MNIIDVMLDVQKEKINKLGNSNRNFKIKHRVKRVQKMNRASVNIRITSSRLIHIKLHSQKKGDVKKNWRKNG